MKRFLFIISSLAPHLSPSPTSICTDLHWAAALCLQMWAEACDVSACLPLNPLILSHQHEKSMAVWEPAAARETCTWEIWGVALPVRLHVKMWRYARRDYCFRSVDSDPKSGSFRSKCWTLNNLNPKSLCKPALNIRTFNINLKRQWRNQDEPEEELQSKNQATFRGTLH